VTEPGAATASPAAPASPSDWWQDAVVYQIYPRSFLDTDGDGVGDLPGIIDRLDYLRDLGVAAVWLSPIYPSPGLDVGYDVSDHSRVDPIFGTEADFDRLVAETHRRGMKLILDLVMNHTSDRHAWFEASRSSRDNPYADWYLWRDPAGYAADGTPLPPNNWVSFFGGSGWQWEPRRNQFYEHTFLVEQPDLNWRNPQVRQAIYDVMRFWLRRGVDGFRIDVMWHLIKDEQFRDNPRNPNFVPGRPPHEELTPLYTTDRPEMSDVVAELRNVVDEFNDRLIIGEIYLPLERLVAYYGRDLRGAHLPFNFSLLSAPWHARTIAKLVDEYEAALPPGGWPNWVLGNHDRPRIASRLGRDQARIAAMLLLTLRGTPTIYFGDEIGMTQVAISPQQIRDPFEKRVPGLGVGRDGCRTPMQWDASANAGFSLADPWLPVADDFRHENFEKQRCDPTSMFNLYRRLIALRRSRKALVQGSYRPIAASGDLLLFVRGKGRECLLVALNMGKDPVSLPSKGLTGSLLLSSGADREGESVSGALDLRPHEGVVIDLAEGAPSSLDLT
jgi:alpha-glucosidase